MLFPIVFSMNSTGGQTLTHSICTFKFRVRLWFWFVVNEVNMPFVVLRVSQVTSFICDQED